MMDKVMQDICKKIAEISLSVDSDAAIPVGDTQWRKGYKQACSDIIAMLEDATRQRNSAGDSKT